jgi:hypothetical protein
MNPMAGYGETHLAKRVWEQRDTPSAIGDINPEPKRRCIENPWLTPGISPSSNQIGDIDWDFPPDDGGDMFEDLRLQHTGGVDTMLSIGPLINEVQAEPSLDPVENFASRWPPLPDIRDTNKAILTPISGYSGSGLEDGKTPATTVCLEGDFQESQTILNGFYDVCFGMVSDLSDVLKEQNYHQFSHIHAGRTPSILSQSTEGS